jgi:DNA polymerase (family X)
VLASPYLLRRLGELRVIDAPREQLLVRDGILTVADLQLAIAEQRPAASDAVLRRAAAALADEQRRLMLGRASELCDALVTLATRHCPELESLVPAGGVRRAEPVLSGLTLVGRAADPSRVTERIGGLPDITEVLHRGGRRVIVLFEGHEVDIRIATADDYGSLLFTATGPAEHVAAVHNRRAPRLSGSEEDVYQHAGLSFVPPELRDCPDALQAAAAGSIPPLIDRGDIRGDLHMHTTYSDGRDTLRAMVAGCIALGYEYVAITDHSEHAGAPRTVNASRLAKQHQDILRLREQIPEIQILHGLEADILEDGRVDADDRTLASLDIVVASLHESCGHDRRQLTRRCIAAIRNPLVSAITHPMNQLVGRRDGYDMDYDAIYAAAAETGTALEIDGAPAHLDLDGPHARAAAAAGVTLVIDSDCHRAAALGRQMLMGIGTARRGWIEARHVLNTRPIAEVRAFLARKRGR